MSRSVWILRLVVSLVLALCAGVLVALTVGGARLDALLHSPEPVQQIAGPVAEDPRVQQALPGVVGGLVEERLSEALPDLAQDGVVQDGLVQVAEGVTTELITDDRFSEAWAQSLDQTRTAWLDQLQSVREAQEAGQAPAADAGTLQFQLGPVVELGQTRLVEAVEQLPLVGDAAAGLVQENTADQPQWAVDLGVPDPATVDAGQLARFEGAVQHWPWLGVGAAVLLVLALIVAPGWQRFTALAVAGVGALIAGVLGRGAVEDLTVSASSGLAQAVADSLLAGVSDYAVPAADAVMIGGGVAIAVGVIGLVVGWATSSRSARR